MGNRCSFRYRHGLMKITGSYRASQSSSLSCRVERWKSKKRTDGSAISVKGLGVILTGSMRSLVGGRSEETLLPGQVRCNLSGLRALGPYQQSAGYKHVTIHLSLLLNNTTPHCPLSHPKVAERDLSFSSSHFCRGIAPGRI
jgi:hypothetical protein